jgi:hypothetical protein
MIKSLTVPLLGACAALLTGKVLADDAATASSGATSSPDGHPNSSVCGHLKFLHP